MFELCLKPSFSVENSESCSLGTWKLKMLREVQIDGGSLAFEVVDGSKDSNGPFV